MADMISEESGVAAIGKVLKRNITLRIERDTLKRNAETIQRAHRHSGVGSLRASPVDRRLVQAFRRRIRAINGELVHTPLCRCGDCQ